MDAEVLVKYFNPCGSGTWLITEAEREGDDWRLFGYCHIPVSYTHLDVYKRQLLYG